MKDIKLLDCTIRDGGYYTNWDFDDQLVKEYYNTMASLPIEYIEIGYRSIPQKSYLGKFFYCPEYVMKQAKEALPNKKLTIILNEKDLLVEDIDALLNPCKPYIDLIRMAIDPKNFDRAIEKSEYIKAKGFEIAFNVMYMSSWKENGDFLNSLEKVNGKVDYFYMVDSYGGVLPEEVKEITELVKSKLNVPLGFHGHNNLEMGLINSITAVNAGCTIIDATITGMGRGAGNLKTELLLTYLSGYQGYKITFNELASLVSDFEKLQASYKWGTNLPYMISGANSLPQKDVMSWISKNRYSVSGIVNALQNQKEAESDTITVADFSGEDAFETAVLIGGGPSAITHLEPIDKVLNENKESYCLIHASTRYAKNYHSLPLKQYYCLVGNEGYRLQKVFDQLSMVNHSCILQPLPRNMGTFVPDEVLSHTYQLAAIDFVDQYKDSPLSIALQTAIDLKVKKVVLVGFDGYDLNLNRTQFELSQENQFVIDQFSNTKIGMESWTPTKYKNLKEVSVYSLLK